MKETENNLKSLPKMMSGQMIYWENFYQIIKERIISKLLQCTERDEKFINILSEWHNPIVNFIYKYA